jgi:subtilisin family serine protease
VVVASLDTGVDLAHPDLKARWRGGGDSWFDPYEHTAEPFDTLGHGTQTLGVAVGGDSSGAPIGVAPGAEWIAARIYDRTGQTSTSVIHEAFGWLLDPDGDPSTADAPAVINASWGSRVSGLGDPAFQADLDALRAAGILVVFAAGNAGPSVGSDVSPANNPGAFSTGSVDRSGRVANSSSRGPSSCDGALFPDLVAPGVSVRTTDLSLNGAAQYTYLSGTSFAAPHVAGAAALLLQARPTLSPDEVEDALRRSARRAPDAGPDDERGQGELDVAAAYAWLASDGGVPPPSAIVIVERSLPVAHLGRAYEKALHANGGEPPLRWSYSGDVPDGLTLGQDGVLQGVPSRAGTFKFVLRIDDALGGIALQSFKLSVLPSVQFVPTCQAR